MKKRSLTILFIICFAAVLCFSAIAANKTVDLTVGKSYSDVLTSISSGEDMDILEVPGSKNGITLSCVKDESGHSISISYSGTPEAAGTTEFTILYLDAGVEKSYTAAFNISAPAVEKAEKPAITGKSPENAALSMKQTDKPHSFSVSATGNGTLSYRWTLDGATVGTDSASYEFIPFSLEVGEYTLQCTVTNTLGDYSVVSGSDSPTWTITVTEGDAPKITNKASAAQIDGTGAVNFTVEAEGENLSYQWYLVKTYEKDAIKNGKYGQIEYAGANTNTLKVTCTNAPSTVTSKFVCEVSSPSGITAQSGEYTLYITEDPNLSKVKELNVVRKPDKTEYVAGETLETTGLEIEVVTGKDKQTITSGFVCTPLLLEQEGVQQITVSYGGKTTVFTVTVEKATHDHEWSAWEKDEQGGFVFRKCTVDKCDAKEIFSFSDFLALHPIEAAELGIKEEKKPEKTEETTPQEDEPIENKETEEDTYIPRGDDEKKPEKKKSGNGILWLIIIIALILLAAALYVYLKYYKTPYKKPTGKPNTYSYQRQQPPQKKSGFNLFNKKK